MLFIKIILSIFGICFLVSKAQSQNQWSDIYIAPMAGYAVLNGARDIDGDGIIGLNLGYQFDSQWAMELGHQQASTQTRFSDRADLSSWYVDGLKGWQFGAWQPFAIGSLATWSFDIDNNANEAESETKIDIGGGSFYQFTPALKLRLQAVTSYSIDNQLLDNVFSLGLQWYPGRGDSSRPTIKTEEPEQAAELVAIVPVSPCPHAEDMDTARQLNCPHFHEALQTFELDIRYASNAWKIDQQYLQNLLALADFLKQDPKAHTVVKGYSDSSGNKAANLALSQKRADTVMKALIENYQIDASRLSARGYGEDYPISSNLNKQGRAENRHIHIHAVVNKLVKIQ